MRTVNLKEDLKRFNNCQQALIKQIVESIKYQLQREIHDAKLVKKLTESIAFAIADDIDSSPADGIMSVLTFPISPDSSDLLYAGGPGVSYLHEFVHRVIEEVFKEMLAASPGEH